MKKAVIAVCALACAAFLCACTAGQEEKADLDNTEGEMTEEIADMPEETAALKAVPMRGLMQGSLGGIGSGFLAYTLPEQEWEDYKLCFFEKGGRVPETGKPISETDYYPLEMADYIFPDVRENNASIGKFIEIYFYDTVTIGEDDAEGLAVVAAYDVDGRTCYDTRIYRWNGTGYSAEEKLMQEFNEQYGNTLDYPAEELYRLSCNGLKLRNYIRKSQGIICLGINMDSMDGLWAAGRTKEEFK